MFILIYFLSEIFLYVSYFGFHSMFAHTQYTYCAHSFSISIFYRCVVYQWTLPSDFFLGCVSFLLLATWKILWILSTFDKSLHYGFMIGISSVFLFLPINLHMSILFPKINGVNEWLYIITQETNLLII